MKWKQKIYSSSMSWNRRTSKSSLQTSLASLEKKTQQQKFFTK